MGLSQGSAHRHFLVLAQPLDGLLDLAVLLAAVLGFAILVLGFGLNWLYDPNRGR